MIILTLVEQLESFKNDFDGLNEKEKAEVRQFIKMCYDYTNSALSESEQNHLEASMKENKALMQEMAEK